MKMENTQIENFTKISKNSIGKVLNKVFEKVSPSYYANLPKIGGPGIVVEIDESKFGKRKYNRGHRVEGVWVFGIVERTTARKYILLTVPDRSERTLIPILQRYVHQESIIYSDGWKGYKNLNRYFAQHKFVNHSLQFVDPISGVHTNTIEGTWSAVKKTIPYRGRTKKYISKYLIRFMLLRSNFDFALRTINYLVWFFLLRRLLKKG